MNKRGMDREILVPAAEPLHTPHEDVCYLPKKVTDIPRRSCSGDTGGAGKRKTKKL